MVWLAQHEGTIYRAELLMIAARMHVRRNDVAQAFQLLKQVKLLPPDMDMQLEYWTLQGEVLGRLEQWDRAAEAWARVLKLAQTDDIRNRALYEQATAWLKSEEYSNAVRLYEAIPETARDDVWTYYSAVAQMYTGEVRMAEEKFHLLADKSPSSHYGLLARLELAEQLARRMKENRP